MSPGFCNYPSKLVFPFTPSSFLGFHIIGKNFMLVSHIH